MIESVISVNTIVTPNNCIINYVYTTYDTVEVC